MRADVCGDMNISATMHACQQPNQCACLLTDEYIHGLALPVQQPMLLCQEYSPHKQA